jgi:hypothetical protein
VWNVNVRTQTLKNQKKNNMPLKGELGWYDVFDVCARFLKFANKTKDTILIYYSVYIRNKAWQT